MIPYWLLFGYFASGALADSTRAASGRLTMPLLLGGLLISAMIGLRYQVGADWIPYLSIFRYSAYLDVPQAAVFGDPAYTLLNTVVQKIGGEFWMVNLICGLIFAWGLVRFAVAQENIWLAMLVAVPYLVIVVAMGYSRQAVAISLVMAGLAAHIKGGSVLRFAAYVAIAALFHRTAVIAFPLVAFASQRGRLINALAALAITYLFFDLFLSTSVETFRRAYIETAYASEGAAVRVAMNVVAGVTFLAFTRQLAFSEHERRLWRNFSWAALGLLAMLFILPSSTAVDRLALYIIPLQIAVLSKLPGALAARTFGTVAVIGYAFLVQAVWLNFAAHAQYWVPYRIWPV